LLKQQGETMRLGIALVVLAVLVTPTFDTYNIHAQSRDKLDYQQIANLSISKVSALAWNLDGSRLAIVSFPSILIYDMKLQKLQTLVANAQVSDATWNPDGNQIASVQGGEDETILIWDSYTGNLIRKVSYPEPYTAFAYRLAWSPDGKRISTDSTGRDVLVWELFGDERVYPLKGHLNGRIGETTWSPDSIYIASGGADGTIRVWDVTSRKNVMILNGGGFVDWSPTNEKIAGVGFEAGEAIIWDANTGVELFKLVHEDTILAVKWNFDGTLLSIGGLSGIITIWDAQSGKSVASIKQHTKLITALSWSPNQNLLASASDDGNLRIWRITGQSP
jgi:WD40 repeat protein